jgi:hypothetical protein
MVELKAASRTGNGKLHEVETEPPRMIQKMIKVIIERVHRVWNDSAARRLIM